MKNLFLSFFLCCLFLTGQRAFSQASFSLTSNVCAGTSLTVTANAGTLSATAYSWSSSPSGPIIFSPAASVTSISFPIAGTFTISLAVVTSTGSSHFNATVIVNALPLITLTASDDTICPPQTTTLMATGATNFSWTGTALSSPVGGGVIATPSVTAVYTVTGETSGCISSGTVVVVVGNYPAESSVLLASSAAVCVGETATLTGYGAINYIWTSSSFTGSIAQQSIAATVGSYNLLLSNGGGCTATAVFYLASANCTGIEELGDEKHLAIFPNPFQSELFINMKHASLSEIRFYDSYGKLVLVRNFPSSPPGLLHFNATELKAGVYHLKIVDGQGNSSNCKLIKN
ncbi:hypothetical protein CNR22_14300 [Sphingobacteriaceae bacterium]|nr:hypothetical protein CNR22_14300 [Sphingobacteriaceae bacterium]